MGSEMCIRDRNQPELPVTVLRNLLPYIRTADMDNVEKALRPSPQLYNEFSYLTKRHSKKRFTEARLICPFCLVKGNRNANQTPWVKIQNAFYHQDDRTKNAARDCVELGGAHEEDGSWHYRVKSKTLRDIQSRIIVAGPETFVEYGLPDNRFRTMTSYWTETGLKKGKTVKRLSMAMRDMTLFSNAYACLLYTSDAADE